MIREGISTEKRKTVGEEDTAVAYGTGNVNVLATAAMTGLMEGAALKCIEGFLDKGQASVGTGSDVKHMAATPVGIEIVVRATVCSVNGRLIVFRIQAWDEIEKIAEGTHTRFLIEKERFMSRANSKL